MFVRRSPAIVLSLVLGAAALLTLPSAAWSDGGAAKDVNSCQGSSTYKVKVTNLDGNNSRLQVVGAVWSNDEDLWSWKFRHNGDVSLEDSVRASDDTNRSFRVTTTMINFAGTDNVVFRAENGRTGEVCKGYVDF